MVPVVTKKVVFQKCSRSNYWVYSRHRHHCLATRHFVIYTLIFPSVIINKYTWGLVHMGAWRLYCAGWQCVRMGSGQGTTGTWCCRVHYLHTTLPHPLTLSPYVQMLARGIAGTLGWIRRPHRGRGSRGGHSRGWPATQLPAQVSTGPHEYLLLPLLVILSMLKAALPQLKSSSDKIILVYWWTKLHTQCLDSSLYTKLPC